MHKAKRGYRSLKNVDFSESDLSNTTSCKTCGWPVSMCYSVYPSADAGIGHCMHIVGRWGELSKCENPIMGKKW